jgi:eukaryotic-like serine/threonine-protein kinase
MLGEVIHGYRIDRVLSAEGGFGDVYLATHGESGAEAVVKVLKPEMSALRDIVARFFNEARAAASIHHPGIVQIHNVGYHGERAYLLMERLRGADLASRLASGPLPVERAIVFLRQTAGAIGAAHERGIVHRDLKPANLFVVEDPDVVGGERVKVLDFGIAKLTADTGGGKTQGVFGTPAYMSPEQCASSGAVDARADLYSLGCIFYELVSGRPPFGHGGLELIAAHLRDTPPSPRTIAPWVPPAVEQVILQLLEKQPDRRLPSCAALIAALDAAAQASGLPGSSAPHLAVGRAASASYPTSPTTLGAAAGAATAPPAKRGSWRWLAIAAVVVVVGAVAAVLAVSGSGVPPMQTKDAGVAIAPPEDAPSLAAANRDAVSAMQSTPDAAEISVVTSDAVPAVAAIRDGTSANPSLDASKPGSTDRSAPNPMGSRRVESSRSAKPRVASLGDASPLPATAADQVKKLNEEGKAAMYAGRAELGLSLFQRAYQIEPSAFLLLNIAIAQSMAGSCFEARRTCQRLIATWPSEPPAQKARRLLERLGSCD